MKHREHKDEEGSLLLGVVTPPKILALRRLRKKVSESEASLSHIVRPVSIPWRGGGNARNTDKHGSQIQMFSTGHLVGVTTVRMSEGTAGSR